MFVISELITQLNRQSTKIYLMKVFLNRGSIKKKLSESAFLNLKVQKFCATLCCWGPTELVATQYTVEDSRCVTVYPISSECHALANAVATEGFHCNMPATRGQPWVRGAGEEGGGVHLGL